MAAPREAVNERQLPTVTMMFRADVVKNSKTAVSSNDGEFETSTTTEAP